MIRRIELLDGYEVIVENDADKKKTQMGVQSWAASGKDYDRNIHSNPDANAWAEFFMETFPNCGADHETMRGWFANAMMAMHDHLLAAAKEKGE